ncbi:solute carrier family 39 (zinc transporter), member 1/2/3 [Nematocida sp. AWRm77]|nr:solute carrier family 39 (zinc transporter), member 1/2/3 [Nematocida sp. AWRm77]
MDSEALVNAAAAVLFIFTFAFCYVYKLIKPLMGIYTYIKCFTGGFIVGVILLEVLKDIYVVPSASNIPAIATGVSFFVLFIISKLYIEQVDAKEQDSIPEGASKKQALVFILALSLHSFMEGLGMGTKENKELVWYIVSILVHKWLEAIVLGASVLTSSFSSKTSFSLLLVYSSLTSIGALLGKYLHTRAIGSSGEGESMAKLLMDGIAAGSFLYIGFVEMVGNEFQISAGKNTRKETLKKITSMFTGYLMITSAILLTHMVEG